MSLQFAVSASCTMCLPVKFLGNCLLYNHVNLQVAPVGTSKYVGEDRLFVISPRGHLRRGETLFVTAQAFLRQPWSTRKEPSPSLMVRSLGGGSVPSPSNYHYQNSYMAPFQS
eukprot:SAG31_NODE_2008_length_6673_cov_3.990265_7_plen_113_part_00